jgi:hypothetical protein
MRWQWSPEGGWEEIPTPSGAAETPVTQIDKPNMRWQQPTPAAPPPVDSDLANLLAVNGIQRATDVIAIATSIGLDLAAACAMLEMESAGGFNVWGHDAVDTGGCYIKGAPVTQADYLAYKARRAQLGCQGVGPCQLTFYALQDQADAMGGCWDWAVNCQVGFGVLANNIRTLGLHEGFARYNGSGPAAEAYADAAMVKYLRWQARFSGVDEETMTPDQAQQLADVHQQITGLYQAWGGGLTDDQNTPYNLLQFVMRNNVETHQLRLQVQALQAKLDALPAETTCEIGSLSQADVNRIAAAVVALQKSQAQP